MSSFDINNELNIEVVLSINIEQLTFLTNLLLLNGFLLNGRKTKQFMLQTTQKVVPRFIRNMNNNY